MMPPPDSAQEPPLLEQRKRLRFRSWHRGTKELDLLLGTFADRWLDRFDAGQLSRYERLLENSDPDLFAWIVQGEQPPRALQTDVLALLRTVQTRTLST